MSDFSSPKRGSNIICRVANPTPEKVCEYVRRLPKRIMPEDSFRTIMGYRWFQNEHQAPEQWGLYYIDGINYYPRFNRDITPTEADTYLSGWLKRLIVINPYTRFKTTNDDNLVKSIVKHLEDEPSEHDLKRILSDIINSDEAFIVNEIIVNALNNYSEVLSLQVIDLDSEEFTVDLKPNYKEIIKTKYNMTKKEYFDLFNDINITSHQDEPRQKIYFGAPGTGKSHEIKRLTEKANNDNRVYRTTFHPDSDYSTFVGSYKPAMKSPERDYTPEELVAKLKEIKLSGVSYPCHKFSAQYWKSVKRLTAEQIKQMLLACDFTESMNTEVSKGVAIGEELSNSTKEEQIVYRFVPQDFAKAYTAAWNTTDDVYLIIEEINRGNCAQIFGDLFQLLDRKDGFSEYPVDSDSDLADYIKKELANSPRIDFKEGVKEGTKLVLPPNLYIWATMNTSDQSLFPIDSAFKRRWDWQYIPIADGNKGWKIEAAGYFYDWWKFLEKINEQIGNTTNSEDKKLGYYFCKPKEGIIKAETFVGKVIFYLWNDVFKDFAEEAGGLFVDTDGKVLSFSKFYATSTEGHAIVKEDKVALFLHNLGLDPISANEDDVVDAENNDGDGISERKESLISISIPGSPIILTAESTHFDSFIKALNIIGEDKIMSVVDSLKYKRLNCPVISTAKHPEIEHNDKGYSYYQLGNLFIVKGCKTYTYIRILEDLNQLLNIGLSLVTK